MANGIQAQHPHARYYPIEGDREATGERIGVMAINKRWSELTTAQKRGIVLSGTAQIGLLIAALLDLYRRPKEEIRGNKLMWTLASFVNFVGPITYLLFGRRR
jgi:Phospholipase_D-nuclease N-terminal